MWLADIEIVHEDWALVGLRNGLNVLVQAKLRRCCWKIADICRAERVESRTRRRVIAKEMWLRGGNGAATTFARYFSRKSAPNLRKINPKVPPQEAASMAEALYHIIKQHGPLTVSNTWNHAKEAGINGLNSKTHMKLLLKWMRGRNMLRQFCNHVGSSKKFLLSTLPDESHVNQLKSSAELTVTTGKPKMKRTHEAC